MINIGEFEFLISFAAIMVVVVGLTIGSLWNKKLMKRYWQIIQGLLEPYSKGIKVARFQTSGFKALCKPKERFIERLELFLILRGRWNVLWFPISRVLGYHDRIIFQADFKETPKARLEIIRREPKIITKHLPRLASLEEARTGREEIDAQLMIKTSDNRFAKALVSDTELVKAMEETGSHITRLTVSRESPHFYADCKAEEKMIKPLLSLFFTFSKFLKKVRRPRRVGRPKR